MRRRGRVSRPVQALSNLCHIDGAYGREANSLPYDFQEERAGFHALL